MVYLQTRMGEFIQLCANSPQAKGRVERRNREFQNRLIKAMRIDKVYDLEAAKVQQIDRFCL